VHLGKSHVIKLSESSVAGNVYNEDGLFPSKPREINNVPSNIRVFQLKEGVGDGAFEQLIVLERERECYSAHYDPAK
jgi:hypothetical protein